MRADEGRVAIPRSDFFLARATRQRRIGSVFVLSVVVVVVVVVLLSLCFAFCLFVCLFVCFSCFFVRFLVVCLFVCLFVFCCFGGMFVLGGLSFTRLHIAITIAR